MAYLSRQDLNNAGREQILQISYSNWTNMDRVIGPTKPMQADKQSCKEIFKFHSKLTKGIPLEIKLE